MKKLNLSNRRQEFINFYNYADQYKEKHGGEFDIRNTKFVITDGCTCCGFFDESKEKPLIVSAAKHPLFEATFVHEFCHFQQFIDQDPIYTDVEEDIWEDLKTKKRRMQSWDSVLQYIAMERDCELRSLRFSKKYNLFDNEEYAQNTNTYLYFYQYTFLKNEWIATGKLYSSPIPKMMPKKILPMKTFEKIDMEIMKEYDKILCSK